MSVDLFVFLPLILLSLLCANPIGSSTHCYDASIGLQAPTRQLMDYLQSTNLLPANQSGFRPGHSTETAVLRVLSDILLAVDRGDVAALTLLDLSAAFDTVDYEILLQRLQNTYGISDRWFRSYLLGRSQYVRIGTSCSSVIDLICGVPKDQGSYCTLPA